LVLKLTDEVQDLCKDNDLLKSDIMKISSTIPILLLQTTNTAHSGPLTSACADIPMNKAAVLTTTESGVHPARTLCQLAFNVRNFECRWSLDGFTNLTYKKKPIHAAIATTIKKHQPLIGVKNYFSLPVVSKEERPMPFLFHASVLRYDC
jgi:hypothetical protein